MIFLKALSIKDARSQGGGGCPVRIFCGQGGGGVLQMRTFACNFWRKKTLDFSKFMVHP